MLELEAAARGGFKIALKGLSLLAAKECNVVYQSPWTILVSVN